MESTNNVKISPPEIDVTAFNEHPFATFKAFYRELETFLMSQGLSWTLVNDPIARRAHPTNPWATGNTAAAVKGRKDHAKGQAVLAHILEKFNKITASKDAVHRSKIASYYTEPAYPTGEPFCTGTELYRALEIIFTPQHEGELDMGVNALLERIEQFPGLTPFDIKHGAKHLREFIADVSGGWNNLQTYPVVAAQEFMIFRRLTHKMRTFGNSETNTKGLNLNCLTVCEHADLEDEANKTVDKLMVVLANQLRFWSQDYSGTGSKGPKIQANHVQQKGPCDFCNGPNHVIADCRKKKAYLASQDGKALAMNHNPTKRPRVTFNPRSSPPPAGSNFKARGAATGRRGGYNNNRGGRGGFNNNRGGNNFNRGGSYAPAGSNYKGKNFNPNYRPAGNQSGISVNSAQLGGLGGALPPAQVPPPSQPPGAMNFQPAGALNNILSANHYSVNAVIIGQDTDTESISSDGKPSYDDETTYNDVFGTDSEDSEEEEELAMATDNDADDENDNMSEDELQEAYEIDATPKEINTKPDEIVDEAVKQKVLNMSADELDEAHDIYVATLVSTLQPSLSIEPSPHIRKKIHLTRPPSPLDTSSEDSHSAHITDLVFSPSDDLTDEQERQSRLEATTNSRLNAIKYARRAIGYVTSSEESSDL